MINVSEAVKEVLREGRTKKRYRIAVDGKFNIDDDNVTLRFDAWGGDYKTIPIEVSGNYKIEINNVPYHIGHDINPDTGETIEYHEGVFIRLNGVELEPTVKESLGDDMYNMKWEYYFGVGDEITYVYYQYTPPQ